jgi:hypothetical protein
MSGKPLASTYRLPGLLLSDDCWLLESSSSSLDVAIDTVPVPPGDRAVSAGLRTLEPIVVVVIVARLVVCGVSFVWSICGEEKKNKTEISFNSRKQMGNKWEKSGKTN